MTETETDTPTGYAPAVDAALLERVGADPAWAARVIVAAGCALNTLTYYGRDHAAQRRDFAVPLAEAHTAKDILRNAFVDWDAVREALAPTP